MSKIMRLSNKEKSLIQEFKTINSYNKNIAQKFLRDNYITNEYLTLGVKSNIDHNFDNNFSNNYSRFNDILDSHKHHGIYVLLRLEHNFDNKYLSQSSNDFTIQVCNNNFIIQDHTKIINIKSRINMTIKDNNVLHSLEEVKQKHLDIQDSLKEVFEVFETLKENYTNKFELIKNDFKSYDEVFYKYDLLVKEWHFKNN